MASKRLSAWRERNIAHSYEGKTIFITGATSGIGKEAAYYYASKGAHLIFGARNTKKAEAVKKEFQNDFSNLVLDIYELDVSSLSSISNFVSLFIKDKQDVDVFINNAGIYHLPKCYSVDGLELVMATNFLGVKALNDALLPYLLSLPHQVKVLFTTSVSAHIGKIDYSDFFMEKKYRKMKAYANSKLAVIHYFFSYISRCENTNVIPFLSHPGTCYTPLIDKAYPKLFVFFAKPFMKLLFHCPEKAALTILLAAEQKEAGTYIAPRGFIHMAGYPKPYPIPNKFKSNFEKTNLIADEIINSFHK